MLSKYEHKLLTGWEEVHKRGELTLWILLALRDSPKHMEQIKHFITKMTRRMVIADDKSMYRALRRYRDADMIDFNTRPSQKGGPELKIYQLTKTGKNVLDIFLKRNVKMLFFTPEFKKLIGGIK